MSPRSALILSYAAIIFGAVLIGFTGILFKLAGVEPATGTFWRMIFALPVSFTWMMWEEKGKLPPMNNIGIVVLCGLAFAGDILAFHASLQYTTIAKATLLGGLAPILVMVFALFIHEKPTKTVMISLFIAIMGGILIVSAKGDLQFSAQELKGDLIVFISTFFFASYIVMMRVARQTNKSGAFNFVATLISAVVAFVYTRFTGENIMPQTAQAWGALAVLGLVSHGIGQGVTSFAMKQVPAGIASIVMLFNAPVAALGAAFIFGQIPVMQQYLGGILVIIALVMLRPK